MVPGFCDWLIAGSDPEIAGVSFAGVSAEGAFAGEGVAAALGTGADGAEVTGAAGALEAAAGCCSAGTCAIAKNCGADNINDSAAAVSDRKCKFMSCPSRGVAAR